MSERLPERIDPVRLARKHTRLVGVIPLEKMPRLGQRRMAGDSRPEAEVTFEVTSAGRVIIAGRVAARVQLTCQRCLEYMEWPLEGQFRLALVHGEEEAARLPKGIEPLLWPDGTGSLPELIEDELLLALPLVARHARPADCGPAGRITESGAIPDDEPEDNPFQVLEQLKSDRRDG